MNEELTKSDVIKLFEKLLEIFTTEGWKEFTGDVEQKLIQAKESSFTECKDNESWHERRGFVMALTFILSYESQIRDAYDKIIEEEIT